MSVIQFNNVSYSYGIGTTLETSALINISFQLEKSDCLALVGSTGSGKSTLGLLLNGLLVPTAGKVLIHGYDTSKKKVKNNLWRQVGMVFQYPEMQFFEENVFKEVAFGPSNMELSTNEVSQRVFHALECVGLCPEEIKNRQPHTLSGGQRRRVALASILAMEPEILVLDEPTAGIDPSGKRKILNLIKDLQKKQGLTIVIITHSMEDVAFLANKILVLHQGEKYMFGSPKTIFLQAQEIESAGLTLPFLAKLKYELKKKRVPISDDSLNAEALKKDIIAYLRSKQLE